MAEVEDRDGVVPSDSGLVAAYQKGAGRLAAAVADAVEGDDEWDARIAAGLSAGLELLSADPALARLLLVEALVAGGDARLEYERSMARLAEALRPPVELTGGKPVSEEILLLQAHGLVSYLSGRVLAGEAERLTEDRRALLQFLLAQIPGG